MSRIAVRLGELDLVERLHARIKVHAPQRGRIERRVIGGQHLLRELVAELPPHTGKVYGGVVDASVAPVNDARKMASSRVKEHMLSNEIAMDQRGREGKAGVVIQIT